MLNKWFDNQFSLEETCQQHWLTTVYVTEEENFFLSNFQSRGTTSFPMSYMYT